MSQQQKHIFFDGGLIHFKWFDQLQQKHQLTLFFLSFLSDNVGIWDPNIRQLEYHLKDNLDPDAFIQEINQEKTIVKVLEDGRWWVLDYLGLQAKTLTPNNRAHVSYIEDLLRHDLLIEYAIHRPNNVNYHNVYELEKWEDIDDLNKRKKTKSNYEYIANKGLVRVLKEACETLERVCQGSKEKDKDKEADKEEPLFTNVDRATNSEQKKETDSELVGTPIDQKPTLYYHKLAKQLKEIIPEDVLDGVDPDDIESDLETFHDTLEADGIENPRAIIIDKAKRADWTGMLWKDFDGELFETSTPF